jgi:hypothetical protein
MARLTCQQVVELVTEHLEHALEGPVAAAFDEHVSLCAACARYLRQMTEAVAVLGRLALRPGAAPGSGSPGRG